MKTKLDMIDIKKFLPHRAPMLMVNGLVDLSEDSVSASFMITEDCLFVKAGSLSEAGLIENTAQTCSAIVGQSYFAKDDLEGTGNKVVGFISAIKKAEIFALPRAGETIITKASLVSSVETDAFKVCTMKCTTFREDDLIVDCTINLIIREV